MSKNNVRIAIRDSTDSHNVAFFDNQAGIKYKSANLQRFLAGSASILTIKYNSKDIDTIRSGCKLAFRYKNRDYWLNVMSFEKKGFEVELTAYSLGLELNNETRGEHKPANAMSIAEYVAYYDPEHALTIGVNEVSDKRIKLEWTGTGTILARLFSVANSFGAELDFSVELNDDYSLKRQVLNIYKKGNLGTNKVSQPVRVGKELKVINYSDNIKELRTAVRATGKDGLTIDGLDKKIYDNNKELLYYSSGMTVYAPQSRDRFPSVGKVSNDNWIVEDLGETQYETKEALWGYMYGEIQKKSLPEITYEVEGAIEAGIGDTQTLIDDIHFEPALYVQARVSELEDDILTGKVTKSTFINFERKYSQIADILLKQVEALAEDAAPYIIRLSTNNGYIFKNGEGSSTITARLEKYSKDIAATWKWVVDNKVVGTGDKLTVKAERITNTMAVTVIAYVNGNEVVRDYMTFSNSDDGVGVESIDRYFTSSDQSDGVTIEGAEWSDKPPAPTEDGKYLWAYDEITYTNGTVTTTKPSAVGANFDVDAFRAEIAEDLKDVPNREEFENKITEELANSKAEIETQIETAKTQAESNAKEYADTINQETTKVAELANAAVDKAKQDLAKVAGDLNTAKQDLANSVDAVNTKVDSTKAELTQAKQDLTNSVDAVNTKVDSTKAELTQAKQDLTSHAQQLQTQANAQTELTNRVTTVETTANGTKTTVNELTKTVAQNGKDITSVTARTKTVEDDLLNTKTTLSQVKTTADSTSQKTATLETGLNGLNAKFETLKVGSRNYFKNSKSRKYYIDNRETQDVRTFIDDEFWQNDTRFTKDYVRMSFDIAFNPALPSDFTTNVHFCASPWYNCGGITFKGGTTALQHFDLKFNLSGAGNSYKTDNVFIRLHNTLPLNTAVSLENFNLYLSAVVEDYTQNEADVEQKVAEYKQNADQNYASLQTTVQKLDGTVQHNKTVAEQTAEGFKTRIESLETYKDGETTRANQYFESAKTETARQLTVERTAIAKDYVAKSRYTSDVTGIRNELSATTTTANTIKTNLANYQATNNRAVANLQSSVQTANGDISSLKTKVEAVPGQITSAVSAVESKIPTSVDTINLVKGTGSSFVMGYGITNTTWNETKKQSILDFSAPGVRRDIGSEILPQGNKFFDFKPIKGMTYTQSIMIDTDATFDPNGQAMCSWFTSNGHNQQKAYIKKVGEYSYQVWSTYTWNLENTTLRAFDWYGLHTVLLFRTTGTYLAFYKPKLTTGSLPSDWSPSPEDYDDAITRVSSEIKQTADGLTQLSTKVTSQGSTITSHTNSINSLTTGLNAKVSQSDFNTLSGRVTTAENNIIAKANELSSKITSVEGKIPTSVSQRNLVQGTSVDWSPFVNINTNNNWRYGLATINYGDKTGIYAGTTINIFVYLSADEIVLDSSINPLIAIQGEIIDKNGKVTWTNWDKYHPFYNKWATNLVSGNNYRIVKLSSKVTNDSYSNIKGFKLEIRINGVRTGKFHYRALMITTGDVFPDSWSAAPEDTIEEISSLSSEFKQTTDAIKASVSSLDKSTVKSSSLAINTDGVVIKAGKSTSDFANAVGSYFSVNQNAINLFSDKINVKGNMIVSGAITSDKIASKQINTAHLNGKIITADVISSNAITADAIRAGAVTTDKMSANSINGDRITAGTLDAAKIKAGSISASQIASGTLTSEQIKAGAIKSINIEASAITSDKIASNSIDASKIVTDGLTANIIKGGVLQSLNGSTNFELDTGKLFYNNNNTGVFRVQNGASTMGLKFSNMSVTVSGTSRILSRAILGGDRRETTLDDGKWDKGGFSGIVIETIKGVEPTENEQADALRVIADNIYFTHTYSNDSLSARGWKMETYSPNTSYPGNVVLKPYGINYRSSDIIVGDLRLDNGDGSGYWMRATINVLKACFGHIVNGGISSNALNAIKSELNKISGT